MRKIRYITLEEVVAIHESMVDLYGGSHGLRDLGLLQSALARPQASFAGEDLYPSLMEKAAALFHSLLFNHVFVDGNKRTALTSTARFLYINGRELCASEDELVTFPLRVENNHFSIEKISTWLDEHTTLITF